MNNVKVQQNGNKIPLSSNSNINYKELNNYSPNHDSGERHNNSNEELEEEPEQEELSLAEINHLKQIQEQTLLRNEKYAHLFVNSPPENNGPNIPKELDSDEKINKYDSSEDNTITHNMLEICNESDNEHINANKINPNKERIFKNMHCYFYLDSEPLVVIGPHLAYFIWIFTFISFFSIFIYSLKSGTILGNILYICGYIFFAFCYILLMVGNPGIPTEKKHLDINDLNLNYRQCKICNCIYRKNDLKVNHCEECGICVEGCVYHSNLATKCIGKRNRKFYKAWIVSAVIFCLAIFLYFIF